MTGLAGPKVYWHFTVKAFVHRPDLIAGEWSWATMVEMDKAKAFPDEAETAWGAGGTLQGTVFAFVRDAAGRSADRYPEMREDLSQAVHFALLRLSYQRFHPAGGRLHVWSGWRFRV